MVQESQLGAVDPAVLEEDHPLQTQTGMEGGVIGGGKPPVLTAVGGDRGDLGGGEPEPAEPGEDAQQVFTQLWTTGLRNWTRGTGTESILKATLERDATLARVLERTSLTSFAKSHVRVIAHMTTTAWGIPEESFPMSKLYVDNIFDHRFVAPAADINLLQHYQTHPEFYPGLDPEVKHQTETKWYKEYLALVSRQNPAA